MVILAASIRAAAQSVVGPADSPQAATGDVQSRSSSLTISNCFRAASLRVPDGRPLDVRFVTGLDPNATQAIWPEKGLDWVLVRGEGTQANLHAVRPLAGADHVEIGFEGSGWHVVGIDVRGPVASVPRDVLERDLNALGAVLPRKTDARGEPGGAGSQPAEARNVRIRHTHSAKLIVRVKHASGTVAAPDTAAVVMSKTGQAAEMRLMTDPSTAGVGDLVAFCTYVNGAKQNDVTVRARCLAGGPPAVVTRGGGGVCWFRIDQAGEWLLDFAYAEAAGEGADADWNTYHGTLSFEVGLSGAEKAAGK